LAALAAHVKPVRKMNRLTIDKRESLTSSRPPLLHHPLGGKLNLSGKACYAAELLNRFKREAFEIVLLKSLAASALFCGCGNSFSFRYTFERFELRHELFSAGKRHCG